MSIQRYFNLTKNWLLITHTEMQMWIDTGCGNDLRYGETGSKKRAAVLQHYCKTSWIAMLRILPPTFIAVLQLLDCCRFLKVFAGCNKICTSCAFSNLLCNKWHVRRDSRVSSSNQSVFTQFTRAWFVARQVWTWVVNAHHSFSTRFAAILQNKLQVFVLRSLKDTNFE